MRPDMTINGVSISSLGWLRESIHFPTPQSQTDTIVVPGRNSPIRYTEALGRVSYEPRSFEAVLAMLGWREEFNRRADEIVNRFSGRLVQVEVSEAPGLYALGTVQITPSYDPLLHKGQLSISCEDGDSYRYHTEETVVVQMGDGTVTLENDFMPVVPSVTVDAEASLGWRVGTDTFQKTVSPGTWEFPELELGSGSNRITVKTAGTVTFRYREGRL